MVRLRVRGKLQVLKVLIIVNVFPQMYMGFFEMKNVLMIESDLSWVDFGVVGDSWDVVVGGDCWCMLLSCNFEQFFKIFTYEKNLF